MTCAVGFAGVSLDKLDEVWRRHPNLLLNTVPPNLKSKFSTIMLSPTPAYAEAPQQQEEEDTQYGAHYQQARSRDDVDTIDIAPGPPYSATTVTDTSSSRPRMSINIPEEDPIPYNSIIGSNGESHEASRRHFVSSSTPSRSSSPTSATVAANGVPLATTTSHSSGETTSQMTTIDTNNTTNINTSTLPPLNSETYVIYTNTTATPASTTSDSTTTTTTATTTTTNFTSISTTNSPTSHHQPVRGTYRYDVSWRQDLNEINEESASSAEPLPSFYDHDPATAAANHSMLDDLVAVYTEKHMLMMDTFNNEDADHSLARPRVPNISYHPQSSSATAANERDGLAGLSSTISTSAATTLPTTAAASSKMIEAGFAIVDSQPSHDDSMNHFNNRASNSPPAIIVPQVFSDDSNHQQFPLREEYTPSSQLIQEVGGGDGVPVYEIPSIHSGNDDHHDHRAAQHPPAPPLVGGWNSPSKEEEERKVAMVNATYAAAKSATFALANPIPVYIHSNHSSALEMLPASSSTFPEDVGVVLGDEGDHYSFDVDDKRSNHSSIISNNKTLSCNDDNNIVSAHQPVIAHSLPSSKGLGYSSHSPSPSLRSTSESSSVHRQQHQILHHPQHSSADLSSVGVYDAYPLQADGNPILLGNGGGAEVADLTDHEFRTLEMLVQSIDGTHS